MNVVLTANSPGEVASWLRPMIAAFRDLAPEAALRVCLTPCNFATGAEEAVVRSLPGVTSVYTPRQTVAWAMLGKRPPDVDRGGPGVVLYLGGDQFYAAALARRTGWPAAAYTEGRAAHQRRFQRFFVPDETARRRALAAGAAPERVHVVGDLMLDGLTLRWPLGEGRARLGLGNAASIVGLFPGSRRHELVNALPGFLEVAACLAARRSGIRFVAALSPFVTPDVLVEALTTGGLFTPPPDKLIEQLFGDEGAGAGYPWSPSHRSASVEWVAAGGGEGAPARGVEVLFVRGAPFDVAAMSDVVLTIPGSNTAELAGLGVPTVVVLALDRLQAMPLEGLPGLIGGIPVLGPAIRRKAIAHLDRKTPFLAWPNRRAGRMVTPEIRRPTLEAREVADAVAELLDDEERRRAIGAALKDVMGPRGAARAIAAGCLELAAAAHQRT